MNTQQLQGKGYIVIREIFSPSEVAAITAAIEAAGDLPEDAAANPAFRRTVDLFAIRRFLQTVPAVQPLIFTPAFKKLIDEFFGPGYFPVKSIYFDKPPGSNWFVAWHQDLTISVDRKLLLPDFGPWTVKGDLFAVQPPVDILQGMYTIRIHLDDTDESNGALRVLPGSHRHGIERYSPSDPNSVGDSNILARPTTDICRVPSGGLMIMRPLLQHASSRSSAGKRRRVIHIEFSNAELPAGLHWAEQFIFIL